METWKRIEGCKGNYVINENGVVKNLDTGRIIKAFDNGRGYMRISLGSDNKYYIHRLVAQAFIPNPHNKKEVNHIDGNSLNNNVSNLEWVTSGENTRHAVYTGSLKAWGNKAKPIEAINEETGEVFEFATISEAERAIGSRHITDVLKGKRKHCKGYVFRYLEGRESHAFNYSRAE